MTPKTLVVVVSGSILTYLAAHTAGHFVHAANEIQIRPLTAQQVYYSLTNQQEVVSENTTMERRVDGAESTRRLLVAHPEDKNMSRYVTYPDGTQLVVSDDLMARSTTYLSKTEVAKRQANLVTPPKDCVFGNDVVTARPTIYGEPAVELVSQHTNDPFTRDVSVRLPGLSCFEVTHTLEQRTSPSLPWQVTLGMKTASLSLAQPPDTDFSNYSQYKEMSPGELSHAYALKRGYTPEQCPGCFKVDQAKEAAYQKAHDRTE